MLTPCKRYERDCDPTDLRTFTLQLNHFDRCITDDVDGAAGGRLGFVRIHTRAKSDEILGLCIHVVCREITEVRFRRVACSHLALRFATIVS